MKTVKQYMYDFATKKLTEVTQAPSFISADAQKHIADTIEKSKEKKIFVYFWKKNDQMSGILVTGKAIPADILPEVIEAGERRSMRTSMGSDMLSALLELEIASSLLGLLSTFDEDICSTCNSVTCKKSPKYQKA